MEREHVVVGELFARGQHAMAPGLGGDTIAFAEHGIGSVVQPARE